MKQEEKELLLKYLCARLPYGVKVMKQFNSQVRTLKSIDIENYRVYFVENDVNSPFGFDIEEPLKFHQQIKPYLRPMSSMTEKELHKYNMHLLGITTGVDAMNFMFWIYQNHLDILHLIEKGLALEAPEGMYEY